MDNKLSELSKPLQIFKHPSGRNFWSVSADCNAGEKDVEAFYSQEYVSALLAELEAKTKHISDMEHVVAAAKCDDELWEAMAHRLKTLESIRSDASQVFKEIGNELGCNPDNESIMMAIDELKKRLATPVRLSCETHPRCRTQHAKDVRAAGFTVEGDGQ